MLAEHAESNVVKGNFYCADSNSQGRPYTANTDFGGGGGSGPMEPSVPLKDYVDKGDEVTLARAEKVVGDLSIKVGELSAKIDLKVGELSAKVDALPGRMLWIAAGGVLSTVGLIVTILAFGFDRFDGGTAAMGAFSSEIVSPKMRDEEQAKAMADISAKLDTLVKQPEKE